MIYEQQPTDEFRYRRRLDTSSKKFCPNCQHTVVLHWSYGLCPACLHPIVACNACGNQKNCASCHRGEKFEPAPRKITVMVILSEGEWEIDWKTGSPEDVSVLSLDNVHITCFDVVEYRRAYLEEPIPASVDILDIGYWYFLTNDRKVMRYEPPETDYRESMRL